MKLKIVMNDTRVKHRDKNDSGLAYKRQVGVKSATLSQMIEIDVPDKINGKWKRVVTDLLTRYSRQLKLNERPMVHIADTGLKIGDRIVSFSFRNMREFVNMTANYILRQRRTSLDSYGNVTKHTLEIATQNLKQKYAK